MEDVLKDSALYNAGVKNGDVILSINNLDMNTSIDLRKLLYSLNAGDEIEIKILRDDETHIINAKV